jgi:ABC-type polysaccharide/polyol phosphate export permease
MGSYLSAVWQCRHFWLSLVRMDLRTRYRGSLLGIGWSLLQPLAMTAILCTVFCKIFHQNIYFFGPFLLSGLACWSFVLNATLGGCACFHQAEAYIRQYPAPLAIYPLRTVLGATFHFLLALGIVVVLAGAFLGFANPVSARANNGRAQGAAKAGGTAPEEALGCAKPLSADPTEGAAQGAAKASGTAQETEKASGAAKQPPNANERFGLANPFILLTLVPTLVLLMVLGWSLAVLGGLANVHFPDTKHLLEVGFQGLFYLTPIMYPPSMLEGRFIAQYLNFNPLTSFLKLLRDPIVEGQMPSPTTFGIAAGTTLLVAGVAVFSLTRLEKRFIYYL